MAKTFSERPLWQRIIMIVGWIAVGLIFFVLYLAMTSDPEPGSDDYLAQLQSMADYRQELINAGDTCGLATAAAGVMMERSQESGVDRYEFAEVISRMEMRCTAAWMEFGELSPPSGLTDDRTRRASDATEICRSVAYARKELAKSFMPVIDGDERPSVLVELRREVDGAVRVAQQCTEARDALLEEGM